MQHLNWKFQHQRRLWVGFVSPCFPKLALKPQPIIDVTMVVVDEAQGHHNHKSKYDFNPSSSHDGGSSFKNRLLHRYTTTYTDTYLLCTVWLIMGRCHFWKRIFMNEPAKRKNLFSRVQHRYIKLSYCEKAKKILNPSPKYLFWRLLSNKWKIFFKL